MGFLWFGLILILTELNMLNAKRYAQAERAASSIRTDAHMLNTSMVENKTKLDELLDAGDQFNESKTQKDLLWNIFDSIKMPRFFADKELQGTIGFFNSGFKKVNLHNTNDDLNDPNFLKSVEASTLTGSPRVLPPFFFGAYWHVDDGALVLLEDLEPGHHELKPGKKEILLSALSKPLFLQLYLQTYQKEKGAEYADSYARVLSWAGDAGFNEEVLAKACPEAYHTDDAPKTGAVHKMAIPMTYNKKRLPNTPNKDSWVLTHVYRRGVLYLKYKCKYYSDGLVYVEISKMSLILKMENTFIEKGGKGLPKIEWPPKADF